MYEILPQNDEVEGCRGARIPMSLGKSIALPVSPDRLVAVAEGGYLLAVGG